MKLRIWMALGVSFFWLPSLFTNAEDSCTIRLTGKLAQEILDNTNIIKPKVCALQEDININVSSFDELSEQLSQVEETLCSKIENLVVTVQVSGIEELSEQISQVEETLCSKIENLVVTVQVSGIEELSEQISLTDATLCSKIGTLDMDGSCLDSQLDVPEDINNLNLTVVQLLKTILLELRGCNGC